jgi:ketosteroid isomerase-like protein
MSRIALVALAAFLTSCSSAMNNSPAFDDQVITVLEGRRNELERVAIARDTEKFISFWAPDVRVREPGTALDGPQFPAYVRDFFSKGQVTALDIRPAKVYVHGDVAYEFGEYDESATLAGQSISVKNNYAMRWRRLSNGTWVIDQLIAGPRGN